MASRPRLTAAILVFVALAGVGWALAPYLLGKATGTVHLAFSPTFAGRPLAFNQFAYANPAGNAPFRVDDFRFYVSNVALVGEGGVYREPDSYHLVRFDSPDGVHRIALKNVPLGDLVAVEFAIGVDPAANGSLEPRGDLDPNNRMAWNWEVGYKFILIEGAIRIDGRLQPLVYHVGFDENRRDQRFETPKDYVLRDGSEVHFTVDLKQVFDGETRIDMARLQSVKFDKADAKMLADNYARMIRAHWK